MNTVVARGAVAADQLVYPWPFPVGAAIEVSCATDEVAVMCPAWAVGDRLGPGRHTWQSPDPSKPVSVYFVLTGPVQVPFAMRIEFPLPATGHNVVLRAHGTVMIQVTDLGLLIAQFVGLPFDRVNDGLMRSVSASVERMLGKVLPRKVAMAGTAGAVADPSTWPALIAELSTYNPTMGAVHGVHFVRFGEFTVTSGDGQAADWSAVANESTAKGPAPSAPITPAGPLTAVSGEIGGSSPPPPAPPPELPLLANGSRVLVALADGLMHSAIIRQAMQGYYELEIETTGDTLWVPVNMVTPQI